MSERNGVLKPPVVLENERAFFLDILISDDVSRTGIGEPLGLDLVVGENLVRRSSEFVRIFVFKRVFVAVGRYGPGVERTDLRLAVKWHGGDAVGVLPLGTQDLVRNAVPGVDFSILLNGGLELVKKLDRYGIVWIVGKLFVSERAEPVWRGIGGGARSRAEEGRRNANRGACRETKPAKTSGRIAA